MTTLKLEVLEARIAPSGIGNQVSNGATPQPAGSGGGGGGTGNATSNGATPQPH